MLDFEQIKSQYDSDLQVYEKALLREYLQCKMLQAIFESKYASKLVFLGGTALRIMYGNKRFSEDLDFDNFDLKWEEFKDVVEEVKKFLEIEGLEVKVRSVSKGAYRCYVKFPGLLYEHGVSPHVEENILIQIDTASQGYEYDPEVRVLNKFDVFTQLRVVSESLLLAQKIYTAVSRKRAKGRDFYDISVLLGRVEPEWGFLKQKMRVKPEKIKREVQDKIADLDFEKLAKDVEPFLIDKKQVERVRRFGEYWEQVEFDQEKVGFFPS